MNIDKNFSQNVFIYKDKLKMTNLILSSKNLFVLQK